MANVTESAVLPCRFSFNLKTLLLVVTGVAILLAPYHWFGGYYLFSALLSLALVVVCTLAYRESVVRAIVVAIGGLIFSFLLVMASPMLLVHAFLNLIAGIGLAICRVRAKTFSLASASVAVGLYAFAIWTGYERVQELMALREKHPFKSQEQRLEFERTSGHSRRAIGNSTTLTPAILGRLDEFEEHQYYSHYYDRAWSLQELHENINLHFARAAGFGVARMGYIYEEDIELKPVSPLALPAPLDKVSTAPSDSDLLPVHSKILLDFGDRNRLGYVRSRSAVSGFEPHQVTANARIAGDEKLATGWQIVRLELVSLLRHDTPRVYTVNQLPPMDVLAEVPHRALNAFEASSLPHLTSAEDLVIDHQPDRIQMLGAVRAAKNCLECHDGDRGQLLGAFSYEIVPIEGTPQPEN